MAVNKFLFSQLVDYAGLFPPAGLNMAEAVANYARYLKWHESWVLGRFVLPVSRLAELVDQLQKQSLAVESPWRLSALVPSWRDGSDEFERAIEAICEFNQRSIVASVDSLEIKLEANVPGERIPAMIGPEFCCFWEIGLTPDLPTRLDWVRDLGPGHAAKIRTGGIEAPLIPKPNSVAEFIVECARRKLAFKATAGLHHPLRAEYALTYEPNSPCATMFGFINVFVAALMARAHQLEVPEVERILVASDAKEFLISPSAIGWETHTIQGTEIATLRNTFAMSFGSCSFEEPVGELRKLGWLS